MTIFVHRNAGHDGKREKRGKIMQGVLHRLFQIVRDIYVPRFNLYFDLPHYIKYDGTNFKAFIGYRFTFQRIQIIN